MDSRGGIGYREASMRSIDDATAAFLEVAADDLQRSLRLTGQVIGMTIEADEPGAVRLAATLRVGSDEVVARGSGTNLLEAYASLAGSAPGPVLASAFARLLAT